MPTSAKLPRARPDPQRVKFPRMNNLITDSIFAWIDRVLQSFRPSPAALTDMRLGPEDNPNNPLMVTCLQNDTSLGLFPFFSCNFSHGMHFTRK